MHQFNIPGLDGAVRNRQPVQHRGYEMADGSEQSSQKGRRIKSAQHWTGLRMRGEKNVARSVNTMFEPFIVACMAKEIIFFAPIQTGREAMRKANDRLLNTAMTTVRQSGVNPHFKFSTFVRNYHSARYSSSGFNSPLSIKRITSFIR